MPSRSHAIRPWTSLLAIVLSSVELRAQDDLRARLGKAFTTIEPVVAELKVPGIVIGITDRTSTLKVITRGYADLKAKKPVTGQTLFEIGSVSKSFTAIALMQAFDEGRFDPRAPVSNYLPWFSVRSGFGPITGHHLLTHTAAIPNYRPDVASMSYAAYALHDYELPYAPGQHFWYSNLGFQILGYALEAIERQRYDTIIERRIFTPLHMSSSIAAISNEAHARLPASYDTWPYDSQFVEQPWFEYRAADGSIASTIGDMLSYARFFLNQGTGPDGRVLSARAFALLTTPLHNNYAYGVRVIRDSGQFIVGHSGAIAGYHADLMADIGDGFAVVVLANGPVASGPLQWIANTLKAAARGAPMPPAPAPQTPRQIAAAMKQFAGKYTAADGTVLEFVSSERGLQLERGATVVPLTRVGPRSFRSLDKDLIAYPFTFEQRDETAVAVSHGPEWYVGRGYDGPRDVRSPPELLALVGRYENHNPEGSPIRVFTRNGRLYAADGFSEADELVRLGENLFRPAQPDFNPERYSFDTIVDGHALRLLLSGMPMYRVDDR